MQQVLARTDLCAGGDQQWVVPTVKKCAEHVRQLEGESPFHNLMEVK